MDSVMQMEAEIPKSTVKYVIVQHQAGFSRQFSELILFFNNKWVYAKLVFMSLNIRFSFSLTCVLLRALVISRAM